MASKSDVMDGNFSAMPRGAIVTTSESSREESGAVMSGSGSTADALFGVDDARDSSGTHGWVYWRGYSLAPEDVTRGVSAVAGRLRAEGVVRGVEVELIMSDGAPSVLAFWALIECDARILLTQAEEWQGATDPARLTVVAEGGGFNLFTLAQVVDLRPMIDELLQRAEPRTGPGTSVGQAAAGPSFQGQWFERMDALGMRTTGTSGAPAVVWKSGPFLRANSIATAESLGYSGADVMLPLLPLGHQYGASVLLISLVQGSSLALCDRRRVSEITRTIQRHGVTAVDAVPRLYAALCDHVAGSPSARDHVEHVRVWGVGGGPLHRGLRQRFAETVGTPLSDGYGSTEFGNVAVSRAGDDSVWLTALSCHRLRVVDVNTGDVLSPGSRGLLEVLPQVVIRADDGRSWLPTGDLAEQDEAGRIRVVGRAGAINRNGYTISPASLARRLDEAGVCGEVVAVEGDANGAFWLVVHDELKRPASWWRQRIAGVLHEHEMPNHIEVLRSLPMRLDQKVDQGALRRMVSALHQSRHGGGGAHPALRMASRIEEHADAVIRVVAETTGTAVARDDLAAMLAVLRHAPAEMELHQPDLDPPVYVCMPANACLESLALYALVPSLWSRRVVVRPARGTERMISEVLALLDDLVRNRVTPWLGDQAAFVHEAARTPGVFVFCGRRTNLQSIQSRLTKRHLVIFFGRGFNPCLVAAGADVETAALATAVDRMYAGGQDCLAPNISFVHASVWDEFRLRLEHHVGRLAEGHPEWPASTVLPAQRPRSLEETQTYLLTHRRHIVSGGVLDAARLTITPTVLTFDLDERPEPTECFGPVFTLVRFEDDDDVFELLGSDLYLRNALGLTAWGVSEDRLRPLAKDYMVGVERSLFGVSTSYEPFGGSGPEAGYVRYGGRQWTGPCGVSKTVKEHWRDGG